MLFVAQYLFKKAKWFSNNFMVSIVHKHVVSIVCVIQEEEERWLDELVNCRGG